MDDGEVEVINSRLPVQSLQHPPLRPAAIDGGVARSAVLPKSLQMAPLNMHCASSSPCSSEFDFYSQTETDSEDCFLDLSSSPGKSSEGSDDGTEGDSPGSQAEHSTARSRGEGSFVGGIAECGSGSGQAISSESAIMAECMGVGMGMGMGMGHRKAQSSSRLPPSISSSTSSSSSVLLAKPITDESKIAVSASGKRSLDGTVIGGSREAKCFSRSTPDAESSPTDSICLRVASLDCSPHSVSSNRAGSGITPSPSHAFISRGKENMINISMDTSADTGNTLDLSDKCVTMSNCAAQTSKAAPGTWTQGDSHSRSTSSAVQGVKRKQYDTVAIVSDSKGGKNKRPKSTMRVASIMSFFTPS